MAEFRASWRPISPSGPLSASRIFGALCFAWRDLFGARALADLLAGFREGEPAFILSEPFPFQGEADPVRFLAAPVLPAWDLSHSCPGSRMRAPAAEAALDLYRHRKSRRFDRVGHVSESVFRELASGRLAPSRFYEETAFLDGPGAEASSGPFVALAGFVLGKDECARLPADRAGRPLPFEIAWERSRISTEGGGTPFRVEGWTRPRGGVHFLVRAAAGTAERIEAALGLSGRLGIGAGRSVGWGRFDSVRVEPAAFPDGCREGAFWTTLSRTVLAPEEATRLAESPRSSYRLVRYEGRLAEACPETGRTAKDPVWCLEAGSIADGPIAGTCPVVHRGAGREVIHYGLACAVRVAPALAPAHGVAS